MSHHICYIAVLLCVVLLQKHLITDFLKIFQQRKGKRYKVTFVGSVILYYVNQTCAVVLFRLIR